MSIVSPQQLDFGQILLDIGQTITIRSITRTVDGNGRITNVSTSDTSTSAVVDEIGDKRKDLLESGYYKVGDINFYMDPDETIDIFDKIIWGTRTMSVKTINYPEKIAGYYPFMEVHCIQDETT